jgi:hypothetical protein
MTKNKAIWACTLTALFISFISVAQSNKLSFSSSETHKDDIVMTWKKDTPEQEMKDDCKALADKGITIKYSDVKRNSNDEITGIQVEYSDRKGNKGNLEYNNQNPIGTITFYKNGDEIGFGTPSQNNYGLAGSDAMFDFSNPQELIKQFQKGNNNSQSFSFSFPKDAEIYGQTKSRIQIQQDGKKPLVIEDGKVIEGGDDYSAEELDKIKSENKIEKYSFSDDEGKSNEFDFRNQKGLDEFKKQMKKIKIQIEDEASENSKSEFDTAKEDMIKAKEEMIKAREELEKTKKELEKSKGKTKSNKA